MSKAPQKLRETLFMTGLVQPVENTGRGGILSILCRQMPGQEKAWLEVVDALLTSSEKDGYDLHICRRYLRKDGRMVFGWCLRIETPNAKSLGEVIEKVCPVLSAATLSKLTPVAEPAVVVQTPVVPVTPLPVVAPPTGRQLPAKEQHIPRVTVHRSKSEDGSIVEIYEMPLPHVYRELNVPKPGSVKGAQRTGVVDRRPQ